MVATRKMLTRHGQRETMMGVPFLCVVKFTEEKKKEG